MWFLSLMAQVVILFVVLVYLWERWSERRMWQQDQARVDEKVALRQKYVALAPDSPSAWESFGDVLREGGYLPEAMDAYQRSIELLQQAKERMDGGVAPAAPPEPQALPAGDADTPAALPAPEETPAPEPLTDAEAETSPTLLALTASGTMERVSTNRDASPAEPGMALVSVGGGTLPPGMELELYTSAEQLVEQEEETGMVVAPSGSSLPMVYSAVPEAVASADIPDMAAGYGLAKKINLVQLEMDEQRDPEKHGQTMRTRQQVCRSCGYLSEPSDTDCRVCGNPLPVNTMLDAWNNDVMRQEAVRQATQVGIGAGIVLICVWFVDWLPTLAKFSVALSATMVIAWRLLKAIGDR